MVIEIDGAFIKAESDFHSAMVSAFSFPSFYGNNLDALWDAFSVNVERPVRLVWKNSEISKKNMGDKFDKIVEIFRKIELQDSNFDLPMQERFELVLV